MTRADEIREAFRDVLYAKAPGGVQTSAPHVRAVNALALLPPGSVILTADEAEKVREGITSLHKMVKCPSARGGGLAHRHEPDGCPCCEALALLDGKETT